MGQLEPEWVIPVTEKVLDGIVTAIEIIVLTEKSVIFYEKKVRF